MYIPRPFEVTDAEAKELLRQLKVAQLVTATSDGPIATLLPWVVNAEANTLISHIARPNRQWNTPWLGQALLIADGPEGYVSPSWYATKSETGRVVPTWDYLVIQVRGDLIIHDDVDWILDSVTQLTNKHEEHQKTPWKVNEAPADYVDGQLRGIVGLEFRVDRIEVAMKMSQNKSEADSQGVESGFASHGDLVMADYVRKYRK
jgi:transcriptional regulator